MESKTIGVIIPIYNTDSTFLKECVDSVLAQDYAQLEICLIDDGSTQKECLELCKKYCRADTRITLIHREYNGGLSESCNIGIEWFSGNYATKLQNPKTRESLYQFEISGENPYGITNIFRSKKAFVGDVEASAFNAPSIDYLLFLDSDDVWNPELVQECVKHAKGTELVWFDHLQVNAPEPDNTTQDSIFAKERAISYKKWVDYARKVDKIDNVLPFVWQFLIDFNYLKRIQLKFINQCQDNLFGVELLYQAHKIYVLPKKLIRHRIHALSETDFTFDESKGAPSFFNIGAELGAEKQVARALFTAFSNYVMKLHWQDFIIQHKDFYGITTIGTRLLQHFHNAYTQCLFIPYTDTEKHLRLCFNLLLHLNVNYKQFRPFSKLSEALEDSKNTNDETAQLILDLLHLENGIILQKNAMINALQERIQALEVENSKLYLESLQDEQNNALNSNTSGLRVFR